MNSSSRAPSSLRIRRWAAVASVVTATLGGALASAADAPGLPPVQRSDYERLTTKEFIRRLPELRLTGEAVRRSAVARLRDESTPMNLRAVIALHYKTEGRTDILAWCMEHVTLRFPLGFDSRDSFDQYPAASVLLQSRHLMLGLLPAWLRSAPRTPAELQMMGYLFRTFGEGAARAEALVRAAMVGEPPEGSETTLVALLEQIRGTWIPPEIPDPPPPPVAPPPTRDDPAPK